VSDARSTRVSHGGLSLFHLARHVEPRAGGRHLRPNPKEFSSYPDGDAGGRPRSSLIVITKDDGGTIGS
jgi:uncharacterized protein